MMILLLYNRLPYSLFVVFIFISLMQLLLTVGVAFRVLLLGLHIKYLLKKRFKFNYLCDRSFEISGRSVSFWPEHLIAWELTAIVLLAAFFFVCLFAFTVHNPVIQHLFTWKDRKHQLRIIYMHQNKRLP